MHVEGRERDRGNGERRFYMVLAELVVLGMAEHMYRSVGMIQKALFWAKNLAFAQKLCVRIYVRRCWVMKVSIRYDLLLL